MGEFAVELAGLYSRDKGAVEAFIFSKSRTFLERFLLSPHFGGLCRELGFMVKNRVGYLSKIKPEKER